MVLWISGERVLDLVGGVSWRDLFWRVVLGGTK